MKKRSSELAEAVSRREGLRYDPEVRAQITKYIVRARRRGVSWPRLSRQLGVPKNTLCGWHSKASKGAGFAEVQVREPAPVGEGSNQVTVVSPTGWRIEGLTVKQAVAVVDGQIS